MVKVQYLTISLLMHKFMDYVIFACDCTKVTYLLTNLLTYSIQHCPSLEVNRFAASHKIPHSLWNPNVHYSIYKCTPPVPILSQIYPVHNLTSHLLKIHLNINLPSTPGSSKLYPSGFPTKILYTPLLYPYVLHSLPISFL